MRLSPREMITIAIGAGVVILTMVWLFVVDPLQEHLATLDRSLAYNQDRYKQMISLSKTHEGLLKTISATEGRVNTRKDFSVLSHLESEADRLGVKRHIVQMKPKAGESTRFMKENQV